MNKIEYLLDDFGKTDYIQVCIWSLTKYILIFVPCFLKTEYIGIFPVPANISRIFRLLRSSVETSEAPQNYLNMTVPRVQVSSLCGGLGQQEVGNLSSRDMGAPEMSGLKQRIIPRLKVATDEQDQEPELEVVDLGGKVTNYELREKKKVTVNDFFSHYDTVKLFCKLIIFLQCSTFLVTILYLLFLFVFKISMWNYYIPSGPYDSHSEL